MNRREKLLFIAVVAILIGLFLVIASIPMFVSGYDQYRQGCPAGNTKVECH